jgi:light-regulated signal transduction histidine kinase (bacteriophytochrome)
MGKRGSVARLDKQSEFRSRQIPIIKEEIHRIDKLVSEMKRDIDGSHPRIRERLQENIEQLGRKRTSLFDELRQKTELERDQAPLTMSEREEFASRIDSETRQRINTEIAKERARRIDEFVDKERVSAIEKTRAEIIAEGHAAHQIMAREEIDRIKASDMASKEDHASLTEDVRLLKEELERIEETKIGDEQLLEMTGKHAREEGGGVFTREPEAIAAAVDCIGKNIKGFQ